MNHLVTTSEVDVLKALLLQAFNHIEDNMVENLNDAKARNYNYDCTHDRKTMKNLRDKIVELDRLPLADDKPVLKLNVTDLDIRRYKLWGSVESSYRRTFGNTISINSNQECESALQDINKELHLNESR